MLQGIHWSFQEVRKELPCPICEKFSSQSLMTLHFPGSLGMSPSPEAANCWDRPTNWLSRPESLSTRRAHSHVSSLKWHQRFIKCNWATQAQSLRFPQAPVPTVCCPCRSRASQCRDTATESELSSCVAALPQKQHQRSHPRFTQGQCAHGQWFLKQGFPQGCITLGVTDVV